MSTLASKIPRPEDLDPEDDEELLEQIVDLIVPHLKRRLGAVVFTTVPAPTDWRGALYEDLRDLFRERGWHLEPPANVGMGETRFDVRPIEKGPEDVGE